MSEGEFYDPYQHRKVAKPLTNIETLLHFLKSALGTGLLAMPTAFKSSGYILGAIATLIVGSICTYGIHLLAKNAYTLCKRRKVPSMTYPELAEAALVDAPGGIKVLGQFAKGFANFFILTFQMGICSVYSIFLAANIKQILEVYLVKHDGNEWIYMLALLPALILINWVRNLKYLAPFSALANLACFIAFFIILYYFFSVPLSLDGKNAFGNFESFSLFMGIVLFALEPIGLVMPLENSMKTPESFRGYFGVINQAMSIVVIAYLLIGLFGYIRFGEKATGSVTLNLPNEEVLAQSAKGLYAFAIYISHAIACYVAIDMIWNQHMAIWFESIKDSLVLEYVTRTLIVVTCTLLAIGVPFLDGLISLVGAFCISVLGLMMPATIEICTNWSPESGNATLIIKNAWMILFGLYGLFLGTYYAILDIIKQY